MTKFKEYDQTNRPTPYTRKRTHNEFRRLLQEKDPSRSPEDPMAQLVKEVIQPGPLTRLRDTRQQTFLQSQSRREISGQELMGILRVEADRSLQEAHIVELAKPDLPDNEKPLFDTLKKIENSLKQGKRNPRSDQQFIELIQKGLQVVSPETWRDYESYQVKFVAIAGTGEIEWDSGEDRNQWQLRFPVEHNKPIAHIMRAIDTLLQFDQADTGQIPGLERRLEIAARAFDGFEKLGEEYGWSTRGAPQAQKYYAYYDNSTRKAFRQGEIDTTTPKGQLEQIGRKGSIQKLLDDYMSGDDRFLTFAPARYIIKEMHDARREGQKPVMVGTEDFDTLVDEVPKRMSKKGKPINPLLITNIKGRKIYLQPAIQSKEVKPPHSVNTKGENTGYSGLTVIRRNPLAHLQNQKPYKLLYMDGQSGHFRSVDPENPMSNLEYALEVFEENGIDTSEAQIEHTKSYHRGHAYSLQPGQDY